MQLILQSKQTISGDLIIVTLCVSAAQSCCLSGTCACTHFSKTHYQSSVIIGQSRRRSFRSKRQSSLKHNWGISRLKMTTISLLVLVSRSSDEPRGDPPPQRETARGRSQLPASAAAEARRHHHPVQLTQAVEHHGEAGPEDHGALSSTSLPAICAPGLGKDSRVALLIRPRWKRIKEDVCSGRPWLYCTALLMTPEFSKHLRPAAFLWSIAHTLASTTQYLDLLELCPKLMLSQDPCFFFPPFSFVSLFFFVLN